MGFEFTDYTTWYYEQMATAVPVEHAGKFVQLRRDQTEYLVIAPIAMCKWHANIVERFLRAHDVAGEYNDKHDTYTLYDKNWAIVGGGKWRRSDTRKTLWLGAHSYAYGRFDLAGLKDRLLAVAELNGLDITVE